jgi:hypothetical protein
MGRVLFGCRFRGGRDCGATRLALIEMGLDRAAQRPFASPGREFEQHWFCGALLLSHGRLIRRKR